MRPVLAARAAGTTPATQRLTGLLDRAAALANAESELDAPDLRVLGENEAVQAWEDAAHRERTTVYAALAREFGITSETEPDGVAPSEAQRLELRRLLAAAGAHRAPFIEAAQAMRLVRAAPEAGTVAGAQAEFTALLDRDAVLVQAELALDARELRGGEETTALSPWRSGLQGTGRGRCKPRRGIRDYDERRPLPTSAVNRPPALGSRGPR
jgi:hypothetical protein